MNDRLWDYKCQSVEQPSDNPECYQSGYLLRNFTLTCKSQHYLTAIDSSSHENGREWRVECCKAKVAVIKKCDNTNQYRYVNGWKKQFKYVVNSDEVITRVESDFDTYKRYIHVK